MSHDDPLEEWLFLSAIGVPPEAVAWHQTEVRAALDRLTDFLDNPPPKRADMRDTGLWAWKGWWRSSRPI